MQGIDISNWQAGINVAAVPCDFVISKATQGTGYVSPDCARQVEQALAAGKAVGIYHYINGAGAVAEMDYFYNNCKGWMGKVVWCLDWESQENGAWGNTGYLDQCISVWLSLLASLLSYTRLLVPSRGTLLAQTTAALGLLSMPT